MVSTSSRSFKPLILAFLVFFLGPFFSPVLFPQEAMDEILSEEPDSLWDFTVDDAEVDVFLLGSWRMRLVGSLGLSFLPESSPEPRIILGDYPGFENIPFEQEVDLTLAVWIQNEFFFESSFKDGFEDSVFLLGYQALDPMGIELIQLGNTGIGISQYPYVQRSSAIRGAFGALGIFNSEFSHHEAMVRFESSTPNSITYQGNSRTEDITIPVEDSIRGRYFLLPDTDVSDLEVWVAGTSGTLSAVDGMFYTKLIEGKDYSHVNATGLLSMQETSGSILIYYSKGSSNIGDSGLGTSNLASINSVDGAVDTGSPSDFEFGGTFQTGVINTWDSFLGGNNVITLSDFQISNPFSNGKTYLKIYQDNRFSPFEAHRYYDLSGNTSNAQVYLYDPSLAQEILLSSRIEGAQIEILGIGTETVQEFRYPITAYGSYDTLYGPGPLRMQRNDPSSTPYLIVRTTEVAESIQIDSEFIPGTVILIRNGIIYNNYTIDESGTIFLSEDLSPGEKLEIRFQESQEGLESGNFSIVSGNSFTLDDYTKLDASLSASFAGGFQSYAEDPIQNPGEITLGTSLEHSTERVNTGLQAAFRLTNPNTTGILRLQGFSSQKEDIVLSADSMLPGPVPYESGLLATAGSPFHPWVANDFASGVRGQSTYTDFSISNDPTQGFVTYDASSIDSSDVYDFSSGNPVGPSPALTSSSDSFSGIVSVFDFDHSASERWTSFLIRPESLLQDDWIDISTIQFKYKTVGLSDQIDLFLQAGQIGEDLDGDGNFDDQISAIEGGFDFDQSGTTLNAAWAASRIEATSASPDYPDEDWDGDDVFEAADPSRIISEFIDSPSAGSTDWQTHTMNLTPQEQLLLRSDSSALSFIIGTDGSGNDTGRVIIGDIDIYGTSLYEEYSSVSDSNNTTGTSSSTLNSLSSDFSDPIDNIQGSSPTYFVADWTATGPGTISWTSAIKSFDPSQYSELVFYVLPSSLVGGIANAQLELLDETQTKVDAQFTLTQSTNWQEIRINLSNGEIKQTLNGTTSTLGTATINSGSVDNLRFSIDNSGAGTGQVYLDEFHASGSNWTASAGGNFFLDLQPDLKLEKESFTYFSLNSLSLDGFIQSETFNQNQSYNPVTQSNANLAAYDLGTSVSLQSEILESILNTNFSFASDWQGNYISSGGHSIQIPASSSSFGFGEGFSRNYPSSSAIFTRYTNLFIRPWEWIGLHFENNANYSSNSLGQSWIGSFNLGSIDILQLDTHFTLNATSSETITQAENYFQSWIEAYNYFLLDPATVQTRNLGAELALKHSDDIVTWSFNFEPSYTSPGPDIITSTDLSVSLGIDDPDLLWDFNLLFSRTSKAQISGANSNIANDIDDLGYLWAEIPMLFYSPPFIDVFLVDLGDLALYSRKSNLLTQNFLAYWSLDLSRQVGSSINDLFLPQQFKLSFNRTVGVNSDTTDSLSVQTNIDFAVLNLFGRLGATKRTEAYDSEEFFHTHSLNWDFLFFELDAWTVRQNLGANFFGIGESTEGAKPWIIGLNPFDLGGNLGVNKPFVMNSSILISYGANNLQDLSSKSSFFKIGPEFSYTWASELEEAAQVILFPERQGTPYLLWLFSVSSSFEIDTEDNYLSYFELPITQIFEYVIPPMGYLEIKARLAWNSQGSIIDNVLEYSHQFGFEFGLELRLQF